MTNEESLPILKVGTIPSRIKITSEPYVRLSVRGYLPCVTVLLEKPGIEKVLVISAKSLAEPLDKLRTANEGKFSGLRFDLSKADETQMALYVLNNI